MPTKKTQLNIGGMHCASCANTITKALQKVSGVKEVNVNFATEKAIIEHDEKVTHERLADAVKKVGGSEWRRAGEEA